MPILVVDTVSKSFQCGIFKQKQILHSISLDVNRGSVVGFIGTNGAGKSTLINLIMGFTRPDCGSVLINDTSPFIAASRKQIGYLPENALFHGHLTAWELLRFSGRISGIENSTLKTRGTMLLNRLGLMYAADSLIRTYSKGMKQRLGLALALLGDPELYILDEPMSGLDPFGRQMVQELILEEKQRGKTIFFSSHILNDVETLCDRIDVIREGRIIFSDTVTRFLDGESDMEKKFVSFYNNPQQEPAQS